MPRPVFGNEATHEERKLEEAALENARKFFTILDPSGSGSINRIKIIKGLKKFESVRKFFDLPAEFHQEDVGSRKKLEAIFQDMDTSQNKEVKWEEFAMWIRRYPECWQSLGESLSLDADVEKSDAAVDTASTVDAAVNAASAANDKLEAATAGGDRAELEEAIRHAEGVPGVDPITLLAAKTTLEEFPWEEMKRTAQEQLSGGGKFGLLQEKARAEEALIAAAAGNDVTALEEAISAAHEAGVSILRIDEAEVQLPEVAERAEALEELSLAVKDNFPKVEVLGKAIARAEAAHVQEAELLEAKQLLSSLDLIASKDELEKDISVAMSRGDRETLRQAIPRAMAAGVSSNLIERATEELASLDLEARCTDASAKLEAAVACGEAAALREAILEAEAAGVEEEQIAAARKILPQAELTEALQGEDIEALEEAIDAASAAKLPMQVLGQANLRLAELKQRVRCTEDLAEALESRDVEMLGEAIKAAEDSGVEAKRIEEAKKVHAELEKGVREERAAKQLSDATAGTDCAKLRQAIAEAKANDLAVSVVEAAELKLATLELQALIKTDNISELQRAIDQGIVMGIEEKLIEKATARVTELQERDQARTKLFSAMNLGNIDVLKKAMYAAGMARVENDHIEAAQEVLDRLKKEAQVRKVRLELTNAMRGSDIEVLKAAMAAAQSNGGIEESLIANAQDILAGLEWRAYQVQVAQNLLDVRDTKDIKALKAAIEEAISAKIDDSKILSARELLTYWEFAAIIPTGDVQALQDCIYTAEASGVHGLMVVEALQKAVIDAEAIEVIDAEEGMVDSRDVMVARKMLELLEKRVNREMASAELDKAIKGESVEDLQRAILSGRQAEVYPSEIVAAEKRILWLEERARARGELMQAMLANDIGLLQWSIVDAEKACVHSEVMRKAKQMLHEMESQAREIEARNLRAYQQLHDAMHFGGVKGIDAVNSCLQEVCKGGFGMRVMSPTQDERSFVTEYDMAQEQKGSTWRAWENAKSSGDLAEMQAVLKEGMRAKLEPWELGMLQKELRFVATADLKAAAQARIKGHDGLSNDVAGHAEEEMHDSIRISSKQVSIAANPEEPEAPEDTNVREDNNMVVEDDPLQQPRKKKCTVM